jgi:hypothetical protein
MNRNKLRLPQVTLIGLDTVDPDRLLRAFRVCQSYVEFGARTLIADRAPAAPLDPSLRLCLLEPHTVVSLDHYSEFMIKRLNDYVETPHALVIQHDGFILNPDAWTPAFLEYDYVGAPWWYEDDFNVGNGGFSLRSKRLLSLLQRDTNIQDCHPEDHCIGRRYRDYLCQQGIRFAPEPLAARFSIEGALHKPHLPIKYGHVWTGQFGFHGFEKTDISGWTWHSEESAE